MSRWRRLLGDRPIVTRLVLAVAVTMTAVLLAAGAFVYWRVEFALNRQLDQDLDAYHAVIARDLATGDTPAGDTPGQSYQVYGRRGRVTGGDATRRLVDIPTVARARTGEKVRTDVGGLLPAADRPYRAVISRVTTPEGQVVLATAISRRKHDEALRELLLQLAIADLATLVAASLVGYGVARAALNPVERYRLAAEQADGAPVLPVADGKDDEVTRLGHTFNALLARIRAANERERQFLGDASHELRSPLSLMRTELEMALLRPRSERETRTTLESLQDQVERLIALSDALLDLEEVREGDVLDGELVDVPTLLTEAAARFAPEAAATGRRVEVAPVAGSSVESEGATLLIEGNRHWLEVALRNLLSNALRHGEGTVTLSAEPTGPGKDRVTLTVSDQGRGVPASFAARAFDRFSRAEPSRSTPGTGLGLSLVQAVAEAHGGGASISGSRVSIELPAFDGGTGRVAECGLPR
jgi:signal transduction histidine kinase